MCVRNGCCRLGGLQAICRDRGSEGTEAVAVFCMVFCLGKAGGQTGFPCAGWSDASRVGWGVVGRRPKLSKVSARSLARSGSRVEGDEHSKSRLLEIGRDNDPLRSHHRILHRILGLGQS